MIVSPLSQVELLPEMLMLPPLAAMVGLPTHVSAEIATWPAPAAVVGTDQPPLGTVIRRCTALAPVVQLAPTVWTNVNVLPVDPATTVVGLTVTVPSPSTASAEIGTPSEARIRATWATASTRMRSRDRVDGMGTWLSLACRERLGRRPIKRATPGHESEDRRGAGGASPHRRSAGPSSKVLAGSGQRPERLRVPDGPAHRLVPGGQPTGHPRMVGPGVRRWLQADVAR